MAAYLSVLFHYGLQVVKLLLEEILLTEAPKVVEVALGPLPPPPLPPAEHLVDVGRPHDGDTLIVGYSMRNDFNCCSLDGVQKGARRKVSPKHRDITRWRAVCCVAKVYS